MPAPPDAWPPAPPAPPAAPFTSAELAGLDANAWFAALPTALRKAMLASARAREVPGGAALFWRGAAPCGLYAVLAGSLSIGAVDADGREALLTIVEPGVWFGEIALFDGLPRTHDAIAIENTRLLQVSQAALQQLLAREPRYWREFARLMAQKLRMSFLNAEALSLLPAAQRLAGRLLMIAEGYGGVALGRTRVRLSQDKLAALTSLTRQTTNQLLRSLAARGIVRLHVGEIEILDVEALRTASGTAGLRP